MELHASFGGRLEGIADEDHGLPFFKKRGAEIVVKLDGRLVPVQNFPAHAKIFLAPSDSGDMLDQGGADAALTKGRADKKVIQKQAGAALKRGVKLEKHGVSNGLAIPLRNDGAKFRPWAEAVPLEVLFRHTHLVLEMFKGREFADHRDQ